MFGWKSFSKRVWDGKNKVNIIFVTSQVFVFSLDPEEKNAVILLLPSKTFLEVVHGYGDYPLESIYQLGEIEDYDGGILLSESLQENLRIPIEAYLVVANSNFKFQMSNIKKYIVDSLRFSLVNSKTNLTKWDLFRLWLETRKIRQDKMTLLDLEELDTTERFTFPDGTEGLKIDFQKFKKIALSYFKDSKIRQENLEIAVLNSTSYSGLATRVADLIENIGGRVVEIGETEKSKIQNPKSKCEIRSKREFKKSYTLRKLEKVFGCQWEEEDTGDYRGDVVLIVTEQYWKMLKEK